MRNLPTSSLVLPSILSTSIPHPWTYSYAELLQALQSSPQGLLSVEAQKRHQQFGKNIVTQTHIRTPLTLFVSQFQNWLIIMLLGAAGVSFFLGEQLDAIVVLAIVFMSAIVGFFQEYRAERTIEKLNAYISSTTLVYRNDAWIKISSEDLVVGDMVKLHMGDRVPADMRLVEAVGLQIDESILTGESRAIEKTTQSMTDKNASMTDQHNCAFFGSFISQGFGTGVVYAIGTSTYFGQTARLIQKELPTDFQKQLQSFSAFLLRVTLVLTMFVFLTNALLHKGILNSLFFAIALAVGITPELLPIVITITLSQGALRMAKKSVIVKKLASVEDLGNIDTLCTDKTGTLTEGRFTLTATLNEKGQPDSRVFTKALVCSTGFSTLGKGVLDQIDMALWKHNETQVIEHALGTFTIVEEHPFDFERRMMSVVVQETGLRQGKYLLVKGAPDSIIAACEFSQKTSRASLLQQAQTFESEGYKAIAVAEKIIDHQTQKHGIHDEHNLTFCGWLLFEDPVKKDVKESLDLFKRLGVNIKIISGDSPDIVQHVAKKVGLLQTGERVMTGEDLAKLSDIEYEKTIMECSLFARMTPTQKYTLVARLNTDGHIVGYLGDGVNDAPALKAADVGIAVDSGAEVAKAAADIVLLHKDLRVLGEGIEMGRKTFGNIMKYILNVTSANYGNMLTVAFSSLFLPFIPLLPKQILLNNFISDIPALAIATDRIDHNFVKKPKRWDIKFIRNFMICFGLISSVFDFATILPLLMYWHVTPEVFRTGWFVESVLSEIIVAFAIRTKMPFYKSKASTLLVVLSILAGLFAIGLPLTVGGRYLFDFAHVPVAIWGWIATVLFMYFVTAELAKHVFYRYTKEKPSIFNISFSEHA